MTCDDIQDNDNDDNQDNDDDDDIQDNGDDMDFGLLRRVGPLSGKAL